MALSPQERADFDEIVARLRTEETGVGTVTRGRRSVALLAMMIASLLVFAFGLALFVQSPEVVGPIVVVTVMLACGLLAWKAYSHSG